MESAGLVLGYEAFQVCFPIWRCDPRSYAHLKSSPGNRIWQVHHASRAAPTPVAPSDPASGSRTGGALRRLRGRGSRGRWADEARLPLRTLIAQAKLSGCSKHINKTPAESPLGEDRKRQAASERTCG